MSGRKRCNSCGLSKKGSAFAERSDSPDGRAFTCRACNKKAAAEWRAEQKADPDRPLEIEDLGGILRNARLARGLNEGEAARMIGVHHTHIRGLESGKRITSPVQFVRAFEALGGRLVVKQNPRPE